MAWTKTYTISTDVTSGSVTGDKLQAEINAAITSASVQAIDTAGDALTINYDVEPSAGDKTSADTLVLDHGTPTLAEYKAVRYGQIDLKTGSLIVPGFTFDGKVFSTSLNAQTNWNTLKDQEAEFTWPVEISTIDNDAYSLTQANLSAFWTAGRDFVKGHLDSGRALKKSVFDAVDKAAVDAVVDTR